MSKYGNKRDYAKIDLYFNGDYYASTTWARSCKEAVKECVKALEARAHSTGGLGFLDGYIFKHSKLLSAKRSKS